MLWDRASFLQQDNLLHVCNLSPLISVLPQVRQDSSIHAQDTGNYVQRYMSALSALSCHPLQGFSLSCQESVSIHLLSPHILAALLYPWPCRVPTPTLQVP